MFKKIRWGAREEDTWYCLWPPHMYHAQANMLVHTCTHTHTHICTHNYIYPYTYVHAPAHKCPNTHTHTHACTHTLAILFCTYPREYNVYHTKRKKKTKSRLTPCMNCDQSGEDAGWLTAAWVELRGQLWGRGVNNQQCVHWLLAN
jgi:hypothetical protein